DQIDGGYYPGSTGADPNCCIFYNSYDKMTYTATTAYSGSTVQVWKPNSGGVQHNPFFPATNTTSTVTIGEELRIPAGYTVTIQNMTIKFTPQATLVVEGLKNGTIAGANLVLKKCTLDVDTRCAQKMWPGVRVWGDKTISRGYGNQGYIYIDSMSVIQNARIGVELGYSTDDALYDASNVPAPTTGVNAGGGLIKTINSSFINNERAIVYRAYPNTGGITSLLTTTFTTTTTLIETGVSPRYFIGELSYSPNTLIQGCAFGAANYLAQDTGIYTLNSVYSMSQYTGNVWNTVSNMNFGVWSTNSSGSNNMSIKQTKFLNNITGAYIGGITNPTLDTDTFKLYNCTGMFCLSSKSIGVFLDNCTGYKMQKSYFDTYSSGSKTLYGLIISNSGANVNCAFSNTFKNLTRGIQMQYVNYIYQTPTPHNAGGGLVNVCNTFTNISGADMYVPSYTATANVSLNAGYSYTCTTCYSGIHHDQGTGDTGPMGYPVTSGNTFSHTSGGWDVWIDSALTVLAYNSNWWYCSSGCSANKNPVHRRYATSSPIATDVNCATDPYSNGLRISNPVLAVLAAADQAKSVYDSLQNAIASMNPNSYQLPGLRSRLGNTLNRRHRLIDEGIHMLLDDRNDTTMHYVDSLSWLKAMDLPARSRLETAINIKDSSKAVTALNAVVNEEGQSDYVKVYTILLKNLHKTPAEIMANLSNLSAMQEVDANKTDIHAYVKANILLHSVGRSTYTPIVQEVEQANDEQQRVTKQNAIEEINTLISKPNPFKDYTTIRTVITRKINNAFVVITDMLGKEIAKYPVYEGETNINFDASTFNQQIFSCSLIIDGVKIQTNKMVLIK
ncbi:MAG TPA: hypothetical protein VNZ49_12520, partial [Bacteroidia bacterium]|nr:hypothetical protein [Bacteroidia bacterium]